MIACLTENGFMTNSEDFKKIFLNEGDHWDKLAEAHAKAILEHFKIDWKAPAKPKPPTVTKPKPTAPSSSKDLHRVIIGGEQVGAYGDHENILDQVKKALGSGKEIKIQKV